MQKQSRKARKLGIAIVLLVVIGAFCIRWYYQDPYRFRKYRDDAGSEWQFLYIPTKGFRISVQNGEWFMKVKNSKYGYYGQSFNPPYRYAGEYFIEKTGHCREEAEIVFSSDAVVVTSSRVWRFEDGRYLLDAIVSRTFLLEDGSEKVAATCVGEPMGQECLSECQ